MPASRVNHNPSADSLPGARTVARAWTDPAFKTQLLTDPRAACASMGISISGYETLQVVENTDRVHHVVVCTSCSCTPSPLTGATPKWYKSDAYRGRVVGDPRTVLAERGLELAPDVTIRVIDTTPERRCLVLPARPPLSDGLPTEELEALVTQDSLFGVAEVPGPVGA